MLILEAVDERDVIEAGEAAMQRVIWSGLDLSDGANDEAYACAMVGHELMLELAFRGLVIARQVEAPMVPKTKKKRSAEAAGAVMGDLLVAAG